MTEERVYVIGTPGRSTVKIGRSVDPKKRLADIQRMSPVPLEVLWSTPGGHELETALHRHFRAHRSHGEWFTFACDPVGAVRWAVSSEPWKRPKVSLKKRRRATLGRPARPTPLPLAVEEPAALAVKRARVRGARDQLVATVATVEDPVDRYQAAQKMGEVLREQFRAQYQAIALTLKNEGRTWRQVGELLGVTGARAEQMSRGAR